MSLDVSFDEAKDMVIEVIENKKAYKKFLELVENQKGDINKLKISEKTYKIKSLNNGCISKINALNVGKLVFNLGAAKAHVDDKIDLYNL